ncbi:hypothetical protein ACIF9R_19235 [Streptomyces sp. NPDC086080]
MRDRVKQAEVDAGEQDGLTSDERDEPARLGRKFEKVTGNGWEDRVVLI